MAIRSFLRRLYDARRGATLPEFAMITPPLLMVLLGLTDFGYRSYVSSVVEGTVHRAARLATVGDKTSGQIDAWVNTQLGTFSTNGTVNITKTNYYQFSGINKAEKLTKDTNANGVLDSGDCFQDLNASGSRDSIAGRNGLGGSDDIVYYTVSLAYPRMIPLGTLLGFSNTQTISATTVMRNQPYASQVEPPVVCLP